jgi:Rrf2 family transcriptional regulator, cysteine metabolism repressor
VELSQKSQYAVRAVFELAKRAGSGPVKAAAIASAEHIPQRFLENILSQLRQAGFVESTRGKEGGYLLARSPKETSVGEIIRLMEGPVGASDCMRERASATGGSPHGCPLLEGCVLLPMWERAHKAMMDVYDGTSFQDLVDDETKADSAGFNYSI